MTDWHFFDNLGQIVNAFQTGQGDPQSVPGVPGSGDPQLPQFFQENGNREPSIHFINFAPTNGTNNQTATTTTFTVVRFGETAPPMIVIGAIETNNTS